MGTSSSNGSHEWVELAGPPGTDLTGWRLVGGDGSPNITLSGTIDASGYFVIASSDQIFQSFTYGQTDPGLSIGNTEESLQLFDDTGILMDTVTPILVSGVERWPAGCGPSGYTCLSTNVCTKNSSNTNYASMERRGDTPDIGANWFTFATTPTVPVLNRDGKVVCGSPGQANWAYSVTATPSKTPSRTPTATRTRTPTPFPTPVPIIVINEVMPRAGHDWNGDGNVDVYDEFIEIKNVGILPANLSNYKLDDEKEGGSAPYTLRSLVLDPGERAVFYGSETGILLSDGGDTVLLLNSRGTIVDAYTYAAAEEPDRSFCRLFSNPGYWRENCFPTPGLENGYSGRYPPGTDGSREPVCLMPDTAPDDFIEAECEAAGSGIWNPEYWNTFPGEGEEQWVPIESEKDPAIYN
ncbi:MAG: lamin tail domain-containing protein [Chloroflexota bacterium]